jgi:hypothetical protein
VEITEEPDPYSTGKPLEGLADVGLDISPAANGNDGNAHISPSLKWFMEAILL